MPSALSVLLKEISFNTGELISPVTSLSAFKFGTCGIEMPAQQANLISQLMLSLVTKYVIIYSSIWKITDR